MFQIKIFYTLKLSLNAVLVILITTKRVGKITECDLSLLRLVVLYTKLDFRGFLTKVRM